MNAPNRTAEATEMPLNQLILDKAGEANGVTLDNVAVWVARCHDRTEFPKRKADPALFRVQARNWIEDLVHAGRLRMAGVETYELVR